MGKIFLLIPPRVYGSGEYGRAHPPLGPLYVAAMLEEEGHCVSFLDAFAENPSNRMYYDGKREYVGLDWDAILQRIAQERPDILLVANLYTNFAKGAEKAVVLLKKQFPHIPLIVGGPHATLLNRDLMYKQPNIDYLITGEGEHSTCALIRELEYGSAELSQIQGLVWRSNGQLKHNVSRFIDDIDILPFPARHLLSDGNYDQRSGMSSVLRSAEIITSRGCPWSCGFCSSNRIWGHRYRMRSLENVLQEIDTLEGKGVNHLYISDDSFNVDVRRTRGICNYLKKRKLLWCCHQGIILKTLTEELLEDMADAGMYCLVMPIESGNQDVLHRLVNKPNDLNHIRRLAKKAKELGLYTIGYYILGFPTETKKQVEDTVRFAEELDLDYSTFTMFRPYPGTPLYDLAKREGLLVGEERGFDEYSYGEARIRSDEYDQEYLERKRRESWLTISKPKLRTNIGNRDIYYASLEPFVERFPKLFNASNLLLKI